MSSKDNQGPNVAGFGGRVIAGRYELGELLGVGGFGAVYTAWDRTLKEMVAVKMLRRVNDVQLERFRREVSVLRLLHLPGVVHHLDDGLHEGAPFLVTEIVHGAPFPGAPIPRAWSEVVDLVYGLLETIARVHAVGVLHRDLKPTNVLMDPSGRPVVLDFGISWSAGYTVDAEGGGLIGTPAYLAPEQAQGATCDVRTDIYSLGVLIYETLSGRLPHQERTLSKMLRAKMSVPVVPLAKIACRVPEKVSDLVARMLAPDRGDRPRSIPEVLRSLERGRTTLTLGITPRLARLGSPASEEALRTLFHGPDRIFHFKSDGARELFARTEGDPDAVEREVGAWIRAGLCFVDGDRLRIDRSALDRLRSGLVVVPTEVVLDGKSVASSPEEGSTLETPPTTLPDAPRTAAPPLSQSLALFGQHPPGRRSQTSETEEAEEIVQGETVTGDRMDDPLRVTGEHRQAAAELPAGAPGRLVHVLRAGTPEEIVDEVLCSAERLRREGQLGEATGHLIEGLAVARGAALVAEERCLLDEYVRVALSHNLPRMLDLASHECSRSGCRDEHVERLEALLHGVGLARGRDGHRALEELEDLPEFEDSSLERWRQGWRIAALALVDPGGPRRRCVLAKVMRWAESTGLPSVMASAAGWAGDAAYEDGRYLRAAKLQRRAAAARDTASGRLGALLSAAGALLEAGDWVASETLARTALDEARELRLVYYQARSEFVSRAARSRSGCPTPPDEELVVAYRALEHPRLKGPALMTEAVIAWRAGEPTVAIELALDCTRAMREAAGAIGEGLAEAFAFSLGHPAAPGDLEKWVAAADSERLPALGLQILELVRRRSGPEFDQSELAARLRRRLTGTDLADQREVLALSECMSDASLVDSGR